MKTRITELLGIKHPIIQGAMGGVARLPSLPVAVSNAGGLGILSGTGLTPEELRQTIKKVKQLTDKPFAVNLLPMYPRFDECMDVIIGEKVQVFSYGAGNPVSVIKRAKEAGLIALPTVGSVKHALRAEQDGADAVIVQGCEGGGRTSYVGTLVLVPLVVDQIKIPVVAAGGFGDARGLVAALALGAEGISMGTRFLVTTESPANSNAKLKLLDSTEEDTLVTTHVSGWRMRCIINELTKTFLGLPDIPREQRNNLAHRPSTALAYVTGDVEHGSLPAGQICGMINDMPTCQELIERIVTGAERILETLPQRVL